MERDIKTKLEEKADLVRTLPAKESNVPILDYAQVKLRRYSTLKLITIITATALATAFVSYEANKLLNNYLADTYRGIVCP